MRASASTEKSQRQTLGPMGARKEMRPLETASTTRYKFPNSATSILVAKKEVLESGLEKTSIRKKHVKTSHHTKF